MSEVILDASALLALLNGEPGHEQVSSVLSDSIIGTVNLSEVMAKLVESGIPESYARSTLSELDLEVIPFDTDLALRAGALRLVPSRSGCLSEIAPVSLSACAFLCRF